MLRYAVTVRVVAVALVTAVCAFGCGDDGPEPVPEGNAAYRGGQVVAPGAQIFYGGEIADDELSVDETGLAAILQGEEIFFYHAALGNAPLNEENSRKAVGFWLAGFDRRGNVTNTVEQALTVLYPGAEETVSSTVGVDLLLPLSDEDSGMTATNQVRRWAAVVSTVDDDTKTTYLLPVSAVLSTNLVDKLAEGFSNESDLAYELATTNVRLNIAVDEEVEVLGSVLRGLPYYMSFLGNTASILEGPRLHPEVFKNLVLLDLATLTTDIVRNFNRIEIPVECAQMIVNVQLADQLTVFVRQQLNGADTTAVAQVADEGLKEFSNSLGQCTVQAAAAAGGAGVPGVFLEVLYSVLDVAALTGFIVEDVLHASYEVAFGADAYERIEIARELDIGLCEVAPSDILTNEDAELTLSCYSRYATAVSADLSALDGPHAVPLTMINDETFRWEATRAVYPHDDGDRIVTFTATDPVPREATDEVSVTVDSNTCGNDRLDDGEICDPTAPDEADRECPGGGECPDCICESTTCQNAELDDSEDCDQTMNVSDMDCPGDDGCFHCQCVDWEAIGSHPSLAQLEGTYRSWRAPDTDSQYRSWSSVNGETTEISAGGQLVYDEATGDFSLGFSEVGSDWIGRVGTAWTYSDDPSCVAIGGRYQEQDSPTEFVGGLFLLGKPYDEDNDVMDEVCDFKQIRVFLESSAM